MLSYGFYNSKGGDRKYDAEQFGAMFNGLITDGVFAHYKDALKVTAGSGNRELVVKPGRAWFNNTWTEVDDNGHSIYLMGSAVETTYFVYLAVNKLDRKNTIAWYNSIANNNPEKGLYFYLLAQVTVPGRVTKISDSMITDTRGSDLCPYVTLWLDRCENVGGSGPGQNVDLTGYAKEEWVQNNYQPKGDYLTAAPVTSVNGRTGKVLLRAPEVGAMPAETEIPGKTSELTNDSGFIDKAVSDLKNYYTKTQTQELIAQIPTFQVLVVQQLPTTGAEKTLYLVPFASDGGNYAEYLWANGAWELLGTPHVDLTGYATEEWVQEMFAGETGAYLPMPKAYNAGEWVFVEEVDGKGNVSKTGTKVLDWVATHTSRVDPSDQVLVPEVTLQTGITNAFGYDTLAGQTEVLVVCDGKLHLCNVEFDYSEGDGYFYHLGNKSLLFQATDTGEPFFFHGYKGTSTMAHFSTAGEHTVEIYGGEEVLIYNKMPEEYLPDCVVRTVNGVAPDENGNVNVDGAGSGQNVDLIYSMKSNSPFVNGEQKVENVPLAVYGFIRTDGTISTSENCKMTDYVPITSNMVSIYAQASITSNGYAVAFFDADKNLLPGISILGNIGGAVKPPQVVDITLDTTYADAKYFTVAYYDTTKVYQHYSCTVTYRTYDGEMDYGLNVLIFGDSITDAANITIDENDRTTAYSTRTISYENANGETVTYNKWPNLISNILDCKDVRNYALNGASYKDKQREVGLERRNASYQIQVALNDLNNPNGVFPSGKFEPDIIIFALGTNDGTPNDTPESALSKIVLNADGYSVDVSATLSALNRVNFCEAVMWAFLTIKRAFPMALAFCVLPIQRANDETNTGTLHDCLLKMANRYGIIPIDGAYHSGIVRDLEVKDGLGTMLKDGLHPNEKGQNLLCRAILTAIRRYYLPFDGMN